MIDITGFNYSNFISSEPVNEVNSANRLDSSSGLLFQFGMGRIAGMFATFIARFFRAIRL
jgi:hypothetical protein